MFVLDKYRNKVKVESLKPFMKYLTLLLAATLIIVCPRAHAVEAISTLGFGPDPSLGIADIHDLFPGTTFGMSFTTGPQAVKLDSVTLEHLWFNPAGQSTLRVLIYKEVFLGPPFPNLTVIGQLSGPVIDPTPTAWPADTTYVQYFPESPIIFEPNTLYWVAPHIPFDSPDVSSLLFNDSFSFGSSGLPGWSLFYFGMDGVDDGTTQEWHIRNQPMKFKVDVSDLNQPPDCSGARPSRDTIWPPNGKFAAIEILGVIDPDGDPVSIAITSITQDEPVEGPDATSPDGSGIGTNTAWLRAERLGKGNGRVYKISFTASDTQGGQSSGAVFVRVPHDQNGSSAVDDGQNYDSTVP